MDIYTVGETSGRVRGRLDVNAPARDGARFGRWLNDPNPESRLPLLPPDVYSSWGFEGRPGMVIASRKTVVVRMGLIRGPSAKVYLAFLKDVLEVPPAQRAGRSGHFREYSGPTS